MYMRAQQRTTFLTKPNLTLYNRINNEQIIGDLINEETIEGKHFYVLRVGARTLKLAKDAYTSKKMFAHR